jgi:hypothetical protein
MGILGYVLPMGNHSLIARIQEHRRLAAEVIRLQTELDRERTAVLAALPASFGYPDIDSFIKAVIHACRQPRRKKVAHTPRAKAKAAAQPIKVEAHTGGGIAKAAQAAQVPTEPPRPSGTSLDDPKNFGLLPDLSLLEPTGEDARSRQAKLSEALKFAQQVLHTSGVPAAVWREWRQFERKASDLLRGLNSVAHPEEE